MDYRDGGRPPLRSSSFRLLDCAGSGKFIEIEIDLFASIDIVFVERKRDQVRETHADLIKNVSSFRFCLSRASLSTAQLSFDPLIAILYTVDLFLMCLNVSRSARRNCLSIFCSPIFKNSANDLHVISSSCLSFSLHFHFLAFPIFRSPALNECSFIFLEFFRFFNFVSRTRSAALFAEAPREVRSHQRHVTAFFLS